MHDPIDWCSQLALLDATQLDVLLESIDHSSSHIDWDSALVLLEDHRLDLVLVQVGLDIHEIEGHRHGGAGPFLGLKSTQPLDSALQQLSFANLGPPRQLTLQK